MIPLTPTTRLLFIGDSITDCGWRQDPDQLGHGYVRLVRDHLAARHPATRPASKSPSPPATPSLRITTNTPRFRSQVLPASR